MRTLSIPAALLLFASSVHAQVPLPESLRWTPDAALIERLEARLNPADFHGDVKNRYQLKQYDRYYYGLLIGSRREVQGVWIVPPVHEGGPEPGVHITDKERMPGLRAEGCAQAWITYDVDKDEGGGSCVLGPPSAPELPHWKPDAQTLTHMETLIREAMGKLNLREKLPDLDEYDRYYAGVTDDEVPLIRGIVMWHGSYAAQMHGLHVVDNVSDVPAIYDGGCSNITIAYDASAERLSTFHCDGSAGATIDLTDAPIFSKPGPTVITR